MPNYVQSTHKVAKESTPLLDKVTAEGGSTQYASQVRVLYVLAVLQVLIMTTVSPTLLLYLQRHGLASSTNVSFYFVCTFIKSLVPVFGNIAMGGLASRVGAPRTLTGLCVVFALGLFGMMAARSRLTFALAFTLYATANSGRIVRVVHLASVVPYEGRTEAMSLHTFMSPLGGIMGPLVWLACTQYRGEKSVLGFTLDKFSLAYLIAGVTSLFMATVASRNLVHEDNAHRSDAGSDTPQSSSRHLAITLSDGSTCMVHSSYYRYALLAYFCILTLCVNLTMSLFGETMQPILVNKFGVEAAELGIIYEALMLVALLPPLIVAFLARHLHDRQIIVVGLCLKLTGAALFLPLFAPVQKWQVILGVTLMWKASTFFYTASLSLFTKLLGPMSSGTLLGILSSSSALGYALSQFLLGQTAVRMFNTLSFAVFSMPVLLCLILVVWPGIWKLLDPEHHFVRGVLDAYEATE